MEFGEAGFCLGGKGWGREAGGGERVLTVLTTQSQGHPTSTGRADRSVCCRFPGWEKPLTASDRPRPPPAPGGPAVQGPRVPASHALTPSVPRPRGQPAPWSAGAWAQSTGPSL